MYGVEASYLGNNTRYSINAKWLKGKNLRRKGIKRKDSISETKIGRMGRKKCSIPLCKFKTHKLLRTKAHIKYIKGSFWVFLGCGGCGGNGTQVR